MAFRRLWLIELTVVVAGVGACASPDGAPPAGDLLAGCESELRRRPQERQPARCFDQVAMQDPGSSSRAAAQLEELLEETPDSPWLHFYLGNVLWRRQDLEGARARYLEAAAGFAGRGDPAAEVDARTSLIRLLRSWPEGDRQGLEAQLAAALRTARESAEPVLLARVHVELAEGLLLEGRDLGTAYELLREGEEILRAEGEVDRRYYLGRWFEAMVKTCFSLDRQRLTQTYLHDWKVFLDEEDGSPQLQTTALFLELSVFVTLAPPSQRSRERALELAEATVRAARASRSLRAYVQALRIRGMLLGGEEGRRALEEALAVLGGNDPAIARICRGSLAVNLARDRPGEALALIEGTLAEARAAPESWSALFAYDDSVMVAGKALGRDAALARGREALDEIEELRSRQPADRGRAGVFAAWMGLLDRQVGWLLEGRQGNPSRGELEEAFAVLERKRARVLLEALVRSGAGGRAPPPAPGLTEVEAELEEEEAMLSFQLADTADLFGEFTGGAWLLVSTRGGTRAYPLPDPVALGEPLEGLIGFDDPEEDPELLSYLQRELLGRALGDLPPEIRRLVLIPDGDLHLTPLAALRETPEGRPLVARFELSTVPSATLWLQWRRARRPRPHLPALVVAGPELGHRRKGGRSLGELPFALEEGRTAARLLGEGSELLAGSAASEHRLRELLRRRRFAGLHFSAHARADELSSERSAIYLRAGQGEDGLLLPKEIVAFDLDGVVVVLAACDTAAGQVLRGEGVMSLARYFFEAGARAVIGSLKRLPDREAGRLFDAFYRRIAEGASLQSALTGAQRELIAGGASARTWAHVVLIGDGSLVLRPLTPARWSGS